MSCPFVAFKIWVWVAIEASSCEDGDRDKLREGMPQIDIPFSKGRPRLKRDDVDINCIVY